MAANSANLLNNGAMASDIPPSEPAPESNGPKLSRRSMIGGLAAAAGVAAGSSIIAGCNNDKASTASEGDGSAAANEVMKDFHGDVKLDVRDSKPDWGPWELKHEIGRAHV